MNKKKIVILSLLVVMAYFCFLFYTSTKEVAPVTDVIRKDAGLPTSILNPP